MTQGPIITEQAPHFALLGATELLACLLQLLLSLTPAQQMAIRVKPYQSGLDLLHHLFRLDRLVEEPLRFAPSPSRVARHASGILAATVQLGHFSIDLAGHLHLILGLFPRALLDTLKLALAMKHVKTHRDRGYGLFLLFLGLGLTLLVGSLHPFLKTRASIGNDMLQVWPLLDDLTPALAAAIRTPLPRQPRQADGLNTHQNGLAMKKDFVQTQDQYQALARPIQDLQDAARLLSAVLHPAPHRGPAGHHTAGQYNRQQDHSLGQAQPHGSPRRGQLTLFGLPEVCGFRPGLPQGLIFGLEPLLLSPQVLIADATGLFAGHRLDHALSMLIDSRAAITALFCPPCHRAPGATHHRRRIANPLFNR